MGLIRFTRRELNLAIRQAGNSAIIVMFFILSAILFPLGIGPDPNLLSQIAPGVVWITALLAAMLSFERLFAPDYQDGSLEQLVLNPVSLETIVLSKAIAHWLTTGLPLLLAAPFIALMYELPHNGYGILMAAMILGTPTISLVGTLGSALTLGARRGGIRLSLVVLPLVIPVMIFGTTCVNAGIGGYTIKAHLMLLGALLLGSLIVAPVAAAAAIRQALD